MGRIKQDLVGQTFGYWTVICLGYIKKYRKYWKCKCRCGKEKCVNGSQLLNGANKSCGCRRAETKDKQAKNLLNQVFGNWVVMARGRIKDGNRYWKCRCICGKEKEVLGKNLYNEISKSCGCAHLLGLTNKQFGFWTVLTNTYDNENGQRRCKCKCICGQEKEISASTLLKGTSKSCGCMKLELAKATNIEKYGVDNPSKNPEIALKIAKSMNNAQTLVHWSNKQDIICVASFEASVIKYLNAFQINYDWHPSTFTMPDNRTYTPDLYLPDLNRWIEIKGYFWGDAKEKWEWFHKECPNSELWNEEKLKEMGIL